MKLINLILIILFTTSCFQLKKGNAHKMSIDKDSIEFVSIKKQLNASDSIYFLTNKEIQQIVYELNNSKYKGLYKMIPKFLVHINFKNDSVRTFRTNGKLIKENNDFTYSLSTPLLIADLWKKAGTIPPPPKPPTIIGCDSINKKAKTDYQNGVRIYDILGTVETTKFELFYWKFMKEKYKITIKANDQPSVSEECYAETMNYEIEKEYGENFIEQTIKEAKKLYKAMK